MSNSKPPKDDTVEGQIRTLLEGVWHSRSVDDVVPELLAIVREQERIGYERGFDQLLGRMEVDMDELKLNPSGWVMKRQAEIKREFFEQFKGEEKHE